MAAKPVSRIAWLALVLALLTAAAAVSAGFGTRWGLWDYRTGFAVLRWSAWSGIGVAVLALIAALASLIVALVSDPRGAWRGFGVALVALVGGLLVFAVPWHNLERARSVPPIHDITTDTEDPPQFRALLPLRRGAHNPPTYGGTVIAEQQRAAYPDIVPLETAAAPAKAFQAALATARAMGWTIVAREPDDGRIEATDRTFWFGFTDDIVVRIEQTESGGSRVDIRSESRVGRSDAGTNAKRVRAFLAALRERLAKEQP